MTAIFILTLSTVQLDVVRDALHLASRIGVGSMADVQRWWGNDGGYGTKLSGDLEALTRRMTGLRPRTIEAAPLEARIAWDLLAVIRTAQAARRINRTPDFSGCPNHSGEPTARVDCLRDISQASLTELEAIPAPDVRILPPLRPKTAANQKADPMAKATNPVKKTVKKVAPKKVAAKKAK